MINPGDDPAESHVEPSPGRAGLLATKTCLEIPHESAPKCTRIVLTKLEMAHMDTPCDPEDEDEADFEQSKSAANDDFELVTAPFAVKTNHGAIHTPLDGVEDAGPKLEIERKKTSTEAPPERKVLVCPKLKNVLPGDKNVRKAVATRKRLMAALFEGQPNISKCNFCQKALPSDGSYMKAPCGHEFHNECVEDRPRCPECGEIIEKGFTI